MYVSIYILYYAFNLQYGFIQPRHSVGYVGAAGWMWRRRVPPGPLVQLPGPQGAVVRGHVVSPGQPQELLHPRPRVCRVLLG